MAFTYPLLAEVPRHGGDIPRSAASVTSVIYRGKKIALCWHKAFSHSEHSRYTWDIHVTNFVNKILQLFEGRFAGGKLGECDDVGFGSQCMVSLSPLFGCFQK